MTPTPTSAPSNPTPTPTHTHPHQPTQASQAYVYNVGTHPIQQLVASPAPHPGVSHARVFDPGGAVDHHVDRMTTSPGGALGVPGGPTHLMAVRTMYSLCFVGVWVEMRGGGGPVWRRSNEERNRVEDVHYIDERNDNTTNNTSVLIKCSVLGRYTSTTQPFTHVVCSPHTPLHAAVVLADGGVQMLTLRVLCSGGRVSVQVQVWLLLLFLGGVGWCVWVGRHTTY